MGFYVGAKIINDKGQKGTVAIPPQSDEAPVYVQWNGDLTVVPVPQDTLKVVNSETEYS